MEFSKAYDFKHGIASSFLKTKKVSQPVSFGSGSRASAVPMATRMPASVNGIGIGEKINGESLVRVLTRQPLRISASGLSSYFNIPKSDITIEYAGPIKFMSAVTRGRPPFPGVSVGHYKITAGTLGCFVTDKEGKVYILSNNHVLANTNEAFFGDPVLQKGKLDGGRRMHDRIARLSYLIKLKSNSPNRMDAAIAEVDKGLKLNYSIGNKKKVSGVCTPRNKQKVEKYGRTTGHTKGMITTRNLDLEIDYDGRIMVFEDQFEIKGANNKMFCDGGDSGSLILEQTTAKAVGLLFAGNECGTTFATSIREVLDAFSVKIL
ncbi:MAG: hypothetical protein ABIO04_00875 [Ferruginibacter sp.]